MKFIPLLCFILLISFESIAQRDPNSVLYAQKVEKYRKLKNIGTTLTVTGVVLVVVGISSILKASNSSYNSGASQNTLNSGAETGALAYLLGVGCLGSGIPLWIVGGHSQKKYERKFENLSVGFNITPQKTALTLTYRFGR